MTGIVLATASADLEGRVLAATDGTCVCLPLGPLPADPAALFAQLKDGPSPDVVVLDSELDIASALELASRFDQQCPAISVILVSELYLEIGLEAMRAGVRDMLHPAMDVLDIRIVLDRACEMAQSRAAELPAEQGAADPMSDPADRSGGRVITVVSAKGGVGKTLVATNLAVGLARATENSTVLVDLDLQFGDVSSALNLDPEYSLPDAVTGPAARDSMVLKTFLSQHETGLYVICGPESPAAADAITGADVARLVKMLATEFRFVVVDTAAGLSEHVLAAMDVTNDLVLVTSMDVPGARGLRKELDALTDLAMFTDARHVVLNYADRRGGLSREDVEATIGTGVDVALPWSKAALESVNQGVPLLQSDVRGPLADQLSQLVGRFSPSVRPGRAVRAPRRRRRDVANGSAADAPPRRSLFRRAAAQ
jgi:pilus assembly protein CpaE